MSTSHGTRRKIRVYIAAPWLHRETAKKTRTLLSDAGYEVTARWLDFVGDSDDASVLRREAQHDWTDILKADVLLLLNIEKSEGKAVEQGIALQKGIPVVAIGKPSNVFHRLPHYTWVDTIGKAIQAFPTANPEHETGDLPAAMRVYGKEKHKTAYPDTSF